MKTFKHRLPSIAGINSAADVWISPPAGFLAGLLPPSLGAAFTTTVPFTALVTTTQRNRSFQEAIERGLYRRRGSLVDQLINRLRRCSTGLLFAIAAFYPEDLFQTMRDGEASVSGAFGYHALGPFHWRMRLISIEEMCKLQTFPRGYQIIGSRRSAQKQIGNAVPASLGGVLGVEIIQPTKHTSAKTINPS